MTELPLYPLLTDRRIVQPIWGGQRLAPWLDLLQPYPEQIGETWQVYDTNAILNGPLAGRTLADVSKQYGAALIGSRSMAQYGADFPLLAKFIDAAAPLSIQVHPDDAYAHAHEANTGFHGKTEAWYILDAQPGATVVYGLERPISRSDFAAAVADGTVEELLHRVPVKAGDTIFVPAGTVHAIDAGTMLFEIQEKSDLTYRVYDYGRRDAKTGQPRELHVAKALDVSELAPAPRATLAPLPLSPERALLIACHFFALEQWTLKASYLATTNAGSFEILTLIAGNGSIQWADDSLALRRGDSVVLPAALGSYTLLPASDENGLELLRTYVPDLEQDFLVPLRSRGVDEALIKRNVVQ